jgi:glycosyltransferase involved in cell wall biosynthesis
METVQLPGVLSGAAKWKAFATADLFVFPSIAPYESFGLSLVEAMMWSLPVVVTDFRGNKEVLGGADSPGGICFDPGPNLAATLFIALQDAFGKRDSWSRWGERNRVEFENRFEKDRFPMRLSNALLNLCTGSIGGAAS